MFGRGKNKAPQSDATPDQIHDATLAYDQQVATGTQRILGEMAAADLEKPEGQRVFKYGEAGKLPAVMPKGQYQAAKDAARAESGEHPAIKMTGDTPAVPETGIPIPEDTATPGASVFVPEGISPAPDEGKSVTVNPNAVPTQPEVTVNPSQPQ